ncbi:MAG: hypothetical protein JJE04_23870 [Acidobacteriia bacterium]|nr:hypothetical protein [Terriglobia bacterium]
MFYRLRRSLNYFKFYHKTKRLLDTPPLVQRAAPLTIVSMVAGHDFHLYILAVKSLYRRLGRGRIVMISDGVSPSSIALIQKHIGPVEVVPVETIDTGKCQRGGTWERLVYLIRRSENEYIIQMDADVLCVGPIPEVLHCIDNNIAFALAEGIPKKPLPDWVEDGIARKSDNVVHVFEKQARQFPDADRFLYLRGSSGFAGFAKGASNEGILEDFHRRGLKMLGPRWKEWGTEQLASNFLVANSPNSVPLPKPKYLSYERHQIPNEISLLHFLGYCRFHNGVFARFANQEIDALLSGG